MNTFPGTSVMEWISTYEEDQVCIPGEKCAYIDKP